MILVTGGAGFIGANFVLDWLAAANEPVVNLDKLTYAGNAGNLAALAAERSHHFVHGDIGDCDTDAGLARRSIGRDAVVNLAAETHVDRSIDCPARICRDQFHRHVCADRYGEGLWWLRCRTMTRRLPLPACQDRRGLRFARFRTDPAFSETTPYAPNSPYSATKAASDHLVRAYRHTFELPDVTTNCSNNDGPLPVSREAHPADDRQCAARASRCRFMAMARTCATGFTWRDHCSAIRRVLAHGRPGETYNIGGNCPMKKSTSCGPCASSWPNAGRARDYAAQVTYVTDRPGHDRRCRRSTRARSVW